MLHQIAALLILLAFYGCYFWKMLLQHRQGIHTNQLGVGKTGLVRFVELTVRMATIAVVVAEVVSIALDASLLPPWVRWIGAAMGTCGVAFFITAVITMQDSWRAGVPKAGETELVTAGVFSVSRNPAFLGFDLTYAGILLMFFNWPLLVLTIIAMALLHLQIVYAEEPFLRNAFGEAYAAYARRVGRYLGRRRV